MAFHKFPEKLATRVRSLQEQHKKDVQNVDAQYSNNLSLLIQGFRDNFDGTEYTVDLNLMGITIPDEEFKGKSIAYVETDNDLSADPVSNLQE